MHADFIAFNFINEWDEYFKVTTKNKGEITQWASRWPKLLHNVKTNSSVHGEIIIFNGRKKNQQKVQNFILDIFFFLKFSF